ncbi:carbohydrate ABC transporter permease [Natronococcus pandeyae]|uniref:Carbohydrate ABC transporter permease n=1 Tax=Natronococcus pandeyae TaxID=2055836 RepID=A0A8J8TRR2_9EURY|nr:carbohydrate ABC transporter permease [Natronococcus pandeyae]TYL37807.1 carbohydrate ABC transporter permease [Natronococcus pandeyae]
MSLRNPTEHDFEFDVPAIETLATYVTAYGLGILFLIPLYQMFVLSITPTDELGSFSWFPEDVTFAYWSWVLFEQPLIYRWIFNTLLIATVTTLLVLVFDSLIAFSLTRLEWPGRKLVLGIIVSSFMVPAFVNIIPLFQVINQLGMMNSYWAVILPFTAGPLGVFLLYQFFRDIPEELEEAARMDGFSTFRIYAQIILPLSVPILSALGLFTFVWSWNQFLWPLIVLNSDAMYTIPIGAVTLQSVYGEFANRLMTMLAIVSLPLFIVFLLFQEKLISSVQLQGTTG